MHDRVYRLLLHLYPRQFRESHGDEALLLFRDRLREETGFLGRVKLWFDLLADFAAIRIRGYNEPRVAQRLAAFGCAPETGPMFRSLEEQHLKVSALIHGGALSIVLCASVLFSLEHGRGRLPHQAAMFHGSREVAKMRAHIEFTYKTLNKSKTPKVLLEAIVTPPDGGLLPTGKINFHYGWRTVASGNLVDGRLVVETTLPDNKALALDALYLGDANYSMADSMEFDPSSRFEP